MDSETVLYTFYFRKEDVEDHIFDGVGKLIFGDDMHSKTMRVNFVNKELIVFNSNKGETAILHIYPLDGLVTLDVHYFVEKGKSPHNLESIRIKQDQLHQHFGGRSVKGNCLLVPIRRGASTWRYFATSDERIVEAPLKELVHEVRSPFQKVQIYSSDTFGKVLYLDDDVMLGESDQDTYTHTLLGNGAIDFTGASVFVLGGGDGGVLHVLLSGRFGQPSHVTIADIDEEVIKACRLHMRKICGDDLDTYEAKNKKIIIGDCLDELHKRIQAKEHFDFVINDLSEFPVNKEERGWHFDFATHCSQVLELSLKVLDFEQRPNSRYLARGGGTMNPEFWEQFETDLKRLKCEHKSVDIQIPSFMELYRFYQVWK